MDDYGLASGYITESAMDADTDNFLVNWQGLVTAGDSSAISNAWNVTTLNGIEQGSQRLQSFDGTIREIGDLTLSSWTLNLSQDMLAYLNTTIFASGTAPSAQVTVKTYDQAFGTWDAYWAIVERPRYVQGSEGFDPVNNIYFRGYLLRFSFVSVADNS